MPCVKEDYALKDRKGEVFPTCTDPYCRMHIMNSHEMDMRAYVPELHRKRATYFAHRWSTYGSTRACVLS